MSNKPTPNTSLSTEICSSEEPSCDNSEGGREDENAGFSLCDDEEEYNDLDDSNLPLPGRESHTCDLDQFDIYLNKIRSSKRHKSEPPFHEGLWKFIRSELKNAKPVGYEELQDPFACAAKGPKDNKAFIEKMHATGMINPIHPNLIADRAGIPLKEVLTELLHATKSGMMSLKLTPDCKRCGSMVCVLDKNGKLPKGAYCEGCRYYNVMDSTTKIKVIFMLSNDVFYVLAENFACQPSKASLDATKVFAIVPATFSGSGFRYSIGCRGDEMVAPSLPAGRYRMHCPVARTDNYLVVERDANDEDKPIILPIHVSDYVCRKADDECKTVHVAHGKFHVDVWTDTKSFFVLWVQDDVDDETIFYLPRAERVPFTSCVTLLRNRSFQLLFRDDTEMILARALSRMSSVEKEESRPSNKMRKLDDGTACRDCP